MSQILITNKKYNFKVGHNVKIKSKFYQILGIEWLNHYEKIDSVDANDSADQSFSDNLKPSDGYWYWITHMGIDGALGFQLKFPSVPRWTVHGEKRYIYRHQADFQDKIYKPFLVINPYYPRFTFYNPENTAKEAIMYFEGERWLIKSLNQSDINKIRRDEGKFIYTDLTPYSDTSIGEG